MRLSDFQQERVGDWIRFATRVPDTAGAEGYELLVVGPDAIVERVFADADFEVAIDPERSIDGAEEEFQEDFEERRQAFNEMAQLHQPAELPMFKGAAPDPSTATSLFVSLRRLEGKGTFWGPWTFSYWLPWPFSIWVYPPPFCSTNGCVQPASGDQDLYLYRTSGWYWSLMGASVRGGTARDCVSWSNPPLTSCDVFTWNYAVFRIYAYSTGVGSFTWRGFS